MIKIEILETVQSRSQGLLLKGEKKEVPQFVAEYLIEHKFAKLNEDSKNDNGNGASDARTTQATPRVSKPSNRKR